MRLLAWTTLAVACIHPPPVHAVGVDERELSRFVPSFSLQSGLDGQRAEAGVGTSGVLAPSDPYPSPNQPVQLDSPLTERNVMMTPFVGAAAELMTPALTKLWGRPRGFAHGDVSYAFPPTYQLVKIGNIGHLTVPPGVNVIEETSILGQGSVVETQVGGLLVGAGAGIAFTFDAWGRALRIKTSVEYLREEVDVSAATNRAVAISQPSTSLSDFRRIILRAQDTFVYNGLGPGIDFEVDTRRAGPFVLSVYLGLKAWSFLDNEKQLLFDQDSNGENATYHFLKNQWAFGGLVGLRFRWVPE